MKKILLSLFAVLIFCIGAAKAQTVEYSRVNLMRTDYDNGLKVKLGDGKSLIYAALGSPNSVVQEYSEMDEKNIEVLIYNSNKIYVIDGVLDSYDLNDPSLGVGATYSSLFKVGDLLRTVAIPIQSAYNGHRGIVYATNSFYPYSLDRTVGTSRNIVYWVSGLVFLTKNGVPLDASSEVLFDISNKIINIHSELM